MKIQPQGIWHVIVPVMVNRRERFPARFNAMMSALPGEVSSYRTTGVVSP